MFSHCGSEQRHVEQAIIDLSQSEALEATKACAVKQAVACMMF
jgi:hypothetical protein